MTDIRQDTQMFLFTKCVVGLWKGKLARKVLKQAPRTFWISICCWKKLNCTGLFLTSVQFDSNSTATRMGMGGVNTPMCTHQSQRRTLGVFHYGSQPHCLKTGSPTEAKSHCFVSSFPVNSWDGCHARVNIWGLGTQTQIPVLTELHWATTSPVSKFPLTLK